MNLFKSSKSRLTFPALTSRCCSDQVPVSVFVINFCASRIRVGDVN